jgi:hypothetical protein
MKTKETTKKKIEKYEKWIMNPAYIEQEIKGERLLNKLKESLKIPLIKKNRYDKIYLERYKRK